MKKLWLFLIPLCITSCSSLFIRPVEMNFPVITKLDLSDKAVRGDFALYKMDKDSSMMLELLERDNSKSVVKVQVNTSNQLANLSMKLVGLEGLWFEYHLNQKNETEELYLVYNDGRKRGQDIKKGEKKDSPAELLLNEEGYSIETEAGNFECYMRVSQAKERYQICFLNDSVLIKNVRSFSLDKDEYMSFMKMEKRARGKYKNTESFELFKLGRR